MIFTRSRALFLLGLGLAACAVSCVGTMIRNLTVAPTGKVLEAIIKAKKDRDARQQAGDNHR
jgi:hypothetical protein